jgi:hypothetical protein
MGTLELSGGDFIMTQDLLQTHWIKGIDRRRHT